MSKELLKVAEVLQLNAKAEAEASEKYIYQKQVIAEALEVETDENIISLLREIDSATDEKISDELNHNVSLIQEFVDLTGINVSED